MRLGFVRRSISISYRRGGSTSSSYSSSPGVSFRVISGSSRVVACSSPVIGFPSRRGSSTMSIPS